MAQMTDLTYGDWSTVALALGLENRAVATMLGSYDSSYAYPDAHVLEVNGTEGRLLVRDTVRELSVQRAGDEVGLGVARGLLQRRGPRFPPDLRPPRRRRPRGPSRG